MINKSYQYKLNRLNYNCGTVTPVKGRVAIYFTRPIPPHLLCVCIMVATRVSGLGVAKAAGYLVGYSEPASGWALDNSMRKLERHVLRNDKDVLYHYYAMCSLILKFFAFNLLLICLFILLISEFLAAQQYIRRKYWQGPFFTRIFLFSRGRNFLPDTYGAT